MQLLTGTSGFAYKAWKGSFYPADLSDAGMLRCYAQKLGTVEINNTFYRLPKASVVAQWASQVGEGFVFVLKCPQRVTHFLRLRQTEEVMSVFLKAASALGPHEGPILYQLPPNFPKDLPRLADFLASLPAGGRCAFEFRHPSWSDDEVLETLRRHGAAHCLADTDDAPVPPLVATAGFGYLRLRRADYSPGDLDAWAERIAAAPWQQAFVFFKHEDAGTGPRLAAELAARWSGRGAGSGA